MTAVLALDRVSVRSRNTRILSDVSLSVEDGETVALLGPSGSGKTTVLRTLLGFVLPSAGTVSIIGQPASADGRLFVPPEERHLAVVFQDLALWPHLTVHGNLSFGLKSRGVARADRERRIAEMLVRVGLQGKERRHPAELSGGERQRVAIARALVLDPVAVLLDEPLSNLDVHLKRELILLLQNLFRERKTTVVHVTHDPWEADALASKVAVLENGRLTHVGALSELPVAGASAFVEAVRGTLAGRC
jgi:iron(III) transport system ATP-binding protein